MLTVNRRATWVNIIVTKVGRSRSDVPLYVLCCRPINVVAVLDLSLPGKRQVEKIKLPALGHGDIANCHMLWNGGDWGKEGRACKGKKEGGIPSLQDVIAARKCFRGDYHVALGVSWEMCIEIVTLDPCLAEVAWISLLISLSHIEHDDKQDFHLHF